MVHAKYIKKGGKVYGPYYYESYRDESGKVKKRYFGSELKEEKKFTLHPNYFIFISILLLTISISSLFYFNKENIVSKELNNFQLSIKSSFVNTFSSLKSSITGLTTIENLTVEKNISENISEVNSNESNSININNNLSEIQINNSNESIIDNIDQEFNNESNLDNQNISSFNAAILNNSIDNKLNADVSIEAIKVEINKPVKWIKKIKLDRKSNVSINVPSVSSNIVVKKVEDLGNIEEAKDVKIKDDVLGITGFSVLGSSDLRFNINKIINFIKKLSEFSFTSYSTLDADNITLVVNDNSDEYIVEYETPGPSSSERIIDEKSKEVTIDSSYSYSNVLSYTSLSDSFNDVNVEWVTRNTDDNLQVKKIDSNNNGLLDRVEWITPHLSNQLFKINETNSSSFLLSNSTYILYNATTSDGENITLERDPKILCHFSNASKADCLANVNGTAFGIGNGSVKPWIININNFTTGRQYHGTFIYNGFLYVVSGNGALTDVQYASIYANGSVGAWLTTTSVNVAIGTNAPDGLAVYGGYVYVLGDSATRGIEYAQIYSNGSLSPWTVLVSNFSGLTRSGVSAAAYKGYLYLSGGLIGATYQTDVQYAPIYANGTLGTWLTTTNFTGTRQSHSMVIYNDYMYIIGGSTASNNQYAKILPNGSVGQWTETTNLTTSTYIHTSVVYNNYIYVLGGFGPTNRVEVFPILPSGALGTSFTSSPLTSSLYGAASALYQNYIYKTGGNSVSGAFIEYALLNYTLPSIGIANARYGNGTVTNGTTGNITISAHANQFNNSQGTLEFFVRPNWVVYNDSLNHTFINDELDMIKIEKDYTNFLKARINQVASGMNYSVSYNISNWVMGTDHHIALVWNYSNITFYVDGLMVNQSMKAFNSSIGGTLYLGTNYAFYENCNCTLDEFKVYGYERYNASIFISNISSIETQNGNASGNYPVSGVFTSQIFDTEINTLWNNISWIEEVPYGEEIGADPSDNLTGLVSLYYLNNQSSLGENESNISDNSPLRNNGFSSGTAVPRTNTTDKMFGAASKTFDGSNDFINTTIYRTSLGLKNVSKGNFSIAFWFKTTTTSNYYILHSGDIGITQIGLANSGGSIGVYLQDEGGNFNSIGCPGGLCPYGNGLNNDRWHHFVLLWDSTIKFESGWVDGAHFNSSNDSLVGSNANSQSLGWGPFLIGTRSQRDGFFGGSLDELSIWNITLSNATIRNLYLRGVLNLTFQVRSCDDSACSGESFVGPNNTADTFFRNATFGNLSNISSNRYFQYKAYFSTNDTNYTPVLQEVIIYGNKSLVPNVTAIALGSSTIGGTTDTTNTTEDLICNVTAVGGVGLSVNVSWFKNNISNISFNGTISNNTLTRFVLNNVNTTKGDSWHCGATPKDDSNSTSPQKNTTAIKINNTAPRVETIVLGAGTIGGAVDTTNTTEDLICNVTVTDNDTEPNIAVNVSWFKNNISNISFNGTISNGVLTTYTLNNQNTTKGDSWHCSATAYDGVAFSPNRNSTAIKINNTAPGVAISLGAGTIGGAVDTTNTTEDLYCNVTVTDNDTEPNIAVNVSWFKNNISNISFNGTISNGVLTQYTLNNQNTTKGDSWHCGAVTYDGTAFGAQKNTTAIKINNTAPTIPVLFSPNNDSFLAVRNITLTWNNSTDADGDVLSYYIIVSNMSDFSVTNFTNASAAGISPRTSAGFGNFSDGRYYWRVLGNDSTLNSSFSLASSFVIDNTAPLIFNDGTLPNNTFKNQYNVFVNVTIIETNVANITYSLFNNSALNNTYLVSIIRFNGTITTSFNFTNLPSNLGYYYNVTVVDNASNSNTTDIRLLTLDNTTPTAFNLTNPSDNNRTTDSKPFFDWQDTNDTNFANYTLQIDTVATFSNATKQFNITDSSTNSSYQLSSSEALADGTYYWRVIARDKADNNYTSATFKLFIGLEQNIIGGAPGSGGGGGGRGNKIGQLGTRLTSLELIVPAPISLFANDRIITPIVIRNNGSEPLFDIELSAEKSSDDIEINIEKKLIPQLQPGQKEETELEIIPVNKKVGNYDVLVRAKVRTPSYEDKIKLFINVQEFAPVNATQILERIRFAKGFVEKEEKCSELNGLLNLAEEAFNNKDYNKSIELTERALASCRDLVSYKTIFGVIEKPLRFNADLFLLAIEGLFGVITLIIVYDTYRKWRLRRKK